MGSGAETSDVHLGRRHAGSNRTPRPKILSHRRTMGALPLVGELPAARRSRRGLGRTNSFRLLIGKAPVAGLASIRCDHEVDYMCQVATQREDHECL